MRGFVDLLKQFHSDERGVFAVLFGVMAIVLVAMAGAAVDYTAMETARTRVQIALDSAALGLADEIYELTEEELRVRAEELVLERLNDPSLTLDIDVADANTANGTLNLQGRVTVPMAFVTLVGIPTMSTRIISEVKRSSINIEVAVALDNTGSMGGDIEFLTDGLNGLIDIVVADVQEPTYSKMALAPYAAQVNAGTYANAVRGTPPPAKAIENIYWSGPLINITNATRANPVVVTTSVDHGYANGDIIYINGVTGMTQLNSKFYRVAGKTNTTFQLQTTTGTPVNGTSYNNFTGGSSNNNDKVRKCLGWISASSACQVYVSSTAHGFETGDYIRTNGNVSVNTYRNKLYTITKVGNDVYSLDGVTSTSTTNPLATGGGAWCTDYGCEWYRFNRTDGGISTYRISPCVTERMTDTYTEVPPHETYVGASYYNTSGGCDIDQPFTPLTSDKETLHAEADDMDIHGSTAGHLGTAWAWYLLSPEFGFVSEEEGYIWEEDENIPAEYGAPNTLKVAILMTDGAYNTQYCNGVDSGDIADCTTPDSSTNQARALCAAIKAAGIMVYSVGFRITANTTQANTLSLCASDASKVFLPADGDELVEDFAEIGQDISDLRLSM